MFGLCVIFNDYWTPKEAGGKCPYLQCMALYLMKS
jgi:hypothetical protein